MIKRKMLLALVAALSLAAGAAACTPLPVSWKTLTFPWRLSYGHAGSPVHHDLCHPEFNGLTADGIAGKATQRMLNENPDVVPGPRMLR